MGRTAHEAIQEPTVRRLTKAREEGQVPRSSDLSSALFLVAAVVVCIAFAPSFMRSLQSFVIEGLSGSSTEPQQLLEGIGWNLFDILVIPCIILCTVAAFAGLVQVGVLFVPQVVLCKFDRLAFSGKSKLFGAKVWMAFLFSILKFLIASTAATLVLVHYADDLLHVGANENILDGIAIVGSIGLQAVFASIGCLLILGIFDYCWQRFSWKSELRMTREELIDEHREHTAKGDGKRRQTEWLAKKSTVSVAPSVVVLGNKIAVAIRWNAAAMSAPIVLGMVRGDSVKQQPNWEGAHVVEDNLLASKIASSSDIGLGIPSHLHGEIASLLIRRGIDER